MNIEINVPDGISGGWAVETFTVSEDDAKFANMRAMFHGGRGRLPAGTYKRLIRTHGFRDVIMSNTPDEIRDFIYFVHRAKGSVLVNGLGLGVLLKALINKPEISDITVIEKSEDVIKLVAPTYLTDKRVTIINADAFEWKPQKGKRYNAVWHDIWDGICSDNLKDMEKLHRKYAKRTDYQESCCREQCKRQLHSY